MNEHLRRDRGVKFAITSVLERDHARHATQLDIVEMSLEQEEAPRPTLLERPPP